MHGMLDQVSQLLLGERRAKRRVSLPETCHKLAAGYTQSMLLRRTNEICCHNFSILYRCACSFNLSDGLAFGYHSDASIMVRTRNVRAESEVSLRRGVMDP